MIARRICLYCNFCFEYRYYDVPYLCDSRCGKDVEKDIDFSIKNDVYLKSKVDEYIKKFGKDY